MQWVLKKQVNAEFSGMTVRELLAKGWLLPRKFIHFLRINKNITFNGKYRNMNEKVHAGELAIINVDVTADLSTDNGVLTVSSDFVLCQDISGANYGIAYIITADGLHGTGSNWIQHNYYSKDYQNGAYSTMYKEGMDMFNNGAEYQVLIYDDVVIATSGKGGATIAGVIPADCKEADEYHHSMTFNIADMNSNYGKKENLVQDKTRLNAIALVYDNATHHVLNCAKCHVTLDTDSSTGIKAIRNGNSVMQDCYNLAGQKVDAKYKGIVIRNGKKAMVSNE